MARNKLSTTVYIRPEQDAKLKLLSNHTKVPVAALIREGIDLVLDLHKDDLAVASQLGAPAALPSKETPAVIELMEALKEALRSRPKASD